MKALIIGGGIAGPVLATFLRRIGVEVSLREARRGAASSEGSFLGVAPNGMNVLKEIGVDHEVHARGAVCEGFQFLGAEGDRIATIDGRDHEDRYGARLVIAKRGDLHEVLLDRALRAGTDVRFGARLANLDRSDARFVVARFEDGTEETADFVIGCDGLRSRVRSIALPDSPAPAALGLVDFGGYARCDHAPLEVGWNVMLFGHRAFFGAFKRPDGEIWWFHNGASDAEGQGTTRERILALHEEDPEWVRDVIRATPQIAGPWTFHDIESLPSWHRGRVCVIGDAAHATSPSAGQGASLALEDAMELARCLRDAGEPTKAFAMLEARRRARVETIVKQARRNGSGKAVASPIARWARDRMLPFFLKLGASAQHEQYAYRVAWDAPAA
ncbi:Hypothetical protein I5071_67430 [Sandaracinus amylolyticus]|nr:Hypothetical protein I5071_67430 [Sandaracinus amylolyticus]